MNSDQEPLFASYVYLVDPQVPIAERTASQFGTLLLYEDGLLVFESTKGNEPLIMHLSEVKSVNFRPRFSLGVPFSLELESSKRYVFHLNDTASASNILKSIFIPLWDLTFGAAKFQAGLEAYLGWRQAFQQLIPEKVLNLQNIDGVLGKKISPWFAVPFVIVGLLCVAFFVILFATL